MDQDIEIPSEVPFITLKDAVLFPQAIMPLFIFETRYKAMLNDVLQGERFFAVATLDDLIAEDTDDSEPYHPIAGVGIIRACKQNPDGNLNLIIQGVARVRFGNLIDGNPYRAATVTKITSKPGGTEEEISLMKDNLVRLIHTQRKLGANIPEEVFIFLSHVDDPEHMLDLTIHTLCSSKKLKLDLLETSNVLSRFKKFSSFLRVEIQQLKLNAKLRGRLSDDEIGNN